MENLNVSAAPHICSRTSTKNIMLAGRKLHPQTQEGVPVKVAKHTTLLLKWESRLN